MPERLPYAELIKRECIEFGNFLQNNSYTKSGKGWYRYYVQRADYPAVFSMVTHVYNYLTIEDVYELYLQSK